MLWDVSPQYPFNPLSLHALKQPCGSRCTKHEWGEKRAFSFEASRAIPTPVLEIIITRSRLYRELYVYVVRPHPIKRSGDDRHRLIVWDVSQSLQDSTRGSIATMDWRVNTGTNDAVLHAQ
jgi:hypothetical protein